MTTTLGKLPSLHYTHIAQYYSSAPHLPNIILPQMGTPATHLLAALASCNRLVKPARLVFQPSRVTSLIVDFVFQRLFRLITDRAHFCSFALMWVSNRR